MGSYPHCPEWIDALLSRSLLSPREIITPLDPSYEAHTKAWAAQKQQHPPLVIRPQTVAKLSTLIAHLYAAEPPVDFAIYGQGFGSVSAKDVLIHLGALDSFVVHFVDEYVSFGAGLSWGKVYERLEMAGAYGVVGARTPGVGVAGTILNGGVSWLSSEYGSISDEGNFLDAQAVKYNGDVVWASTEPDLLWALRGGGGGFGVTVLVNIKLRHFPYPIHIWTGQILIPRRELETVAKGIETFLDSEHIDPRVSMLLYVGGRRVLESIRFGSEPVSETDEDSLIIHVYDANGEGHGRENFDWALRIPGAVDQTRVVATLNRVAELQERVNLAKGTMNQLWQPYFLQSISKELVISAVEWSEGTRRFDPTCGDCTCVIFELLCSRDNPTPNLSSWPRPRGTKHILTLGTGRPMQAATKK